MDQPCQIQWYTPEELIQIGCMRSRVVMMNEAHNGRARCRRTRDIGRRILPTAHQFGVRYLAMEALDPAVAHAANQRRCLPQTTHSYLAQPDMQALVQTALDLEWQLLAYEADMTTAPNLAPRSAALTNWREEQQARNLVAAMATLPATARLLVWCGNGHLTKHTYPSWKPMGYQFRHLSQIDPFCIDQTVTVEFGRAEQDAYGQHLVACFATELQVRGGTAGVLTADLALPFADHTGTDVILLSVDNALE